MLIARIEGCHGVLGAPEGWQDDPEHPKCAGLPIRVEGYGTANQRLVSAWIPTPEELARLVAGAHVHLSVYGTGHPPVALTVAEAPQVGVIEA